jgi:starch-binding outer membrane protein SusE/F
MEIPALELARAIVPLLGVEYEKDFPTTDFPVYIRLSASIPNAPDGYTALSNVITLPKVLSYFALDPLVMPENMYAIGDFASWDWSKSFSMIPVNGTAGKFWALLWCEKDKGMKFNAAKAWDNNQFGVADNVTINGISYTASSDKNIVFGETGWHLVVLTTTIVGRSYTYTLDFLAPDVYIFGAANGGIWSADDNWKFSVPTTSDGEFVSPALAADCDGSDAANLRMCVVIPSTDWWRSEFIVLDGKIAYRANGGDQTRVGCKAGQKVHLNILAGTGSIK